MKTDVTTEKKIHYGWVITAACGMLLFYSVGLTFNCFSVFLGPLRADLGLTGTQGSSIVSLVNIGSVIGMTCVCPLYKKIGARTIVYMAGLCMCGGTFLYAFAGTLTVCYCAAVLTGLGFGAGSLIPAALLISAWFQEKRGFAMGISSACTGLATILFSPIFAWIIEAYGRRTAFLLEGAIIFLLATLCFILLRNKPEEKGCHPYGYREETAELAGSAAPEEGVTLKEALHGRRYYIMLAGVLVIAITVQPVISHMSVLYTTNGHDSIFAAFMISIYGISMMIYKPLYGILSDKIGIPGACVVTYVSIVLSFVVGFFVSHTVPAFLFAVLVGAGVAPLSTVAIPLWIGAAFGTKDLSSIFTSYKTAFYLVGAAGATLPGYILDTTGSYLGIFWVYLVCGVFSYLLMRKALKNVH